MMDGLAQLTKSLGRYGFRAGVALFSIGPRRRLNRATKSPQRAQQRALERILKLNAHCKFGQEHDFAGIRDYGEFQRAVEIGDYETFRPYIAEEVRTGSPVLKGPETVRYAVTGASTGPNKAIPFTAHRYRQQGEDLVLLMEFLYKHYEGHRVLKGKIIPFHEVNHLAREAVERASNIGEIPYKHEPLPGQALADRFYALQQPVFAISDHLLKDLLILRLTIPQTNITGIMGANMSSLVRLAGTLNDHLDALLEDLERGWFHRLAELPEEVVRHSPGIHVKHEARAAQLRTLQKTKKRLILRDLWPDCNLLVGWTTSCGGRHLEQAKAELGGSPLVKEIGYNSTECDFGVPLSHGPSIVPNLNYNFFEFCEAEAWESSKPEFKLLHEIEQGKQYYIFPTTPDGLYRYNMADIIEVNGTYNNTPMFHFVRKGGGITDVAQEKVSEPQAIAAMKAAEEEVGIRSVFYLFLADRRRQRYTLLFEPNAQDMDKCPGLLDQLGVAVERQLSKLNDNYRVYRFEQGYLSKLEVAQLGKDTFRAYENKRRASSLYGNLKDPVLKYRDDEDFDFVSHVVHTTATQ